MPTTASEQSTECFDIVMKDTNAECDVDDCERGFVREDS
jgi:hypothetical protein